MSQAGMPVTSFGAHRRAEARVALVAWRWPIWIATFLSLAGFQLAIATSNVVMAGVIGIWLLLAAIEWPTVSKGIGRDKLPWLFPLLAAASVAWSDFPDLSMRAALQLALTTASSLALAAVQPRRSFLSALMTATGACVAYGLATGGTEIISYTNEIALNGGFGSKNTFALIIGLNVITGLGVLLDRGQPGVLRLLGLLCTGGSASLLLAARSVGATLTVVLACAVLLGVKLLAGLSARERAGVLWIGAVAVLCVVIGLAVVDTQDLAAGFFSAVGKSSNLTGRAMLWHRADQLIAAGPLLGHGYEAFWVRDTPEAEALWSLSHVDARMGFHFHNLWYEAAIGFGVLGVAAFGVTLAGMTFRAAKACVAAPGAQTGLVLALLVFLIARTPTEVDMLRPFSPGALLLPALYALAARRSSEAAASQGRRVTGGGRWRGRLLDRRSSGRMLPGPGQGEAG